MTRPALGTRWYALTPEQLGALPVGTVLRDHDTHADPTEDYYDRTLGADGIWRYDDNTIWNRRRSAPDDDTQIFSYPCPATYEDDEYGAPTHHACTLPPGHPGRHSDGKVRWGLPNNPAPEVTPKADDPIPMLLFCPACDLQHIDATDDRTPDWTNPPHKSHLCHGCGHVWRPCDRPTEGVATLTTAGSKDSPPVKPGGESDADTLANAAHVVIDQYRRWKMEDFEESLNALDTAVQDYRAAQPRAALDAAFANGRRDGYSQGREVAAKAALLLCRCDGAYTARDLEDTHCQVHEVVRAIHALPELP